MAQWIPADQYLGVDICEEFLADARKSYPNHRFVNQVAEGESFDTIAMIAVIEHLSDPASHLSMLRKLLKADGHFVITTPPPSAELIHDIGSFIGLFSKTANDEHETLFDEATMRKTAQLADLRVETARRFLWGMNQLFILKQDHSAS